MLRILIFLVLVIYGVPSYASDVVWITPWYGDGKNCVELNESDRTTLVVGLVNGMLMAPFFGAQKEDISWFEACIKPMSPKQIAAIIKKFLDDHPERWHEHLGTLAYAALVDACPSSPKKRIGQ